MLVRDVKRLVLFVAPAVFLVLVCVGLYTNSPDIQSRVGDWSEYITSYSADSQQEVPEPIPDTSAFTAADDSNGEGTHHEVFSATRLDRKYFSISFGADLAHRAINPNIIPHPALDNTYIIVAQQLESGKANVFAELVCNASFQNDILACISAPVTLPIEPTTDSGACVGEMALLSLNVGPHDARVFYGPESGYVLYGSNSAYTCFGQFLQDLRALTPSEDWGVGITTPGKEDFKNGVELRRPGPYNPIEKNWFVFWDKKGDMFAHYDFVPRRSLARLAANGSAGPDLGPGAAAANDKDCMARYLPQLPAEHESIHQATNSLSITMCKRTDPACTPDDTNTFLFTVIHHKKYYNFHSEYDPYVVVFRQEAPFEIYGISQKPIWIHGKEKMAHGQAKMFYVVSMSWGGRGQKYHGYLDDVLFVAFGIEDSDTGGIDVVASDLFSGLGLCSDS